MPTKYEGAVRNDHLFLNKRRTTLSVFIDDFLRSKFPILNNLQFMYSFLYEELTTLLFLLAEWRSDKIRVRSQR